MLTTGQRMPLSPPPAVASAAGYSLSTRREAKHRRRAAASLSPLPFTAMPSAEVEATTGLEWAA